MLTGTPALMLVVVTVTSKLGPLSIAGALVNWNSPPSLGARPVCVPAAGVGEGVGLAVRVGVGEAVRVAVRLAVALAVGVGVGVGVAVPVAVPRGVADGVAEAVALALGVAVGGAPNPRAVVVRRRVTRYPGRAAS